MLQTPALTGWMFETLNRSEGACILVREGREARSVIADHRTAVHCARDVIAAPAVLREALWQQTCMIAVTLTEERQRFVHRSQLGGADGSRGLN